MTHRSTFLLVARTCAIVFALTACGYLVVTAQRRANPVVESTPATVDVELPASVPPSAPVQAAESEAVGSSAPIEASASIPAQAENPAFLYGSKSLVLEPTETIGADEVHVIETTVDPVLLPSSKVGVIATPEPVFMPSSKVKVLNPLPPVQAQTGTPGTTSTTAPVYLPSSKSLKVDVKKLPAKKPAPDAPPKNP